MRTFVILLFAIVCPSFATAEPSSAPRFEGLSERDAEALRAGWERVPRRVRDAVEPVVFVGRSGSCPHGMGAYSPACPTWGAAGEFYIYPSNAPSGEMPQMRLPTEPAARREIFMQRAAVHAVMARADEVFEWSRTARWRRLNGWRNEDRPFNQDVWGYSRPLGMRSARLDFVTFAEEFFVPAGRGDLSSRCQEFTKGRFFARNVTGEPIETMSFPTGCAAFDAWANLDELEGIELLFAAATADQPQSLWGHLLIHLRYRDRPLGMEAVYQFGAVIDSDVGPIEYLTRGLMGGFGAVFDPIPFRTADRIFMQSEQRSLRRFPLRLSRSESLRVLQRIWEIERRHRYPYWFFDENCAAFVVDLFESTDLKSAIPSRSTFVVAPTDVLDHFAESESGDEPLIVRASRDHVSNRSRAFWSRRARQALVSRLSEKLGEAASEPLRELLDDTLETDPSLRKRAHRALGDELVAMVDRGELEPAHAFELMHHTVNIERFYLESLVFEVRGMVQGTREEAARSARETLARRRELYRHEDARRRAEQRMERDLEGMDRGAPRREFTESEQELLAREEAARAAWDDATGALRRVAALTAEDDRRAVAERLSKNELEERVRHDELSEESSGRSRSEIGLRTPLDGAPSATMSWSLIHDRLGLPRRRGIRPDVEMRALGLDVSIPLSERAEGVSARATILRYFTLARSLEPVADSIWEHLGYGFEVGFGVGERDDDLAVDARGGLLIPIASDDRATNHLIATLLPHYRWALSPDPDNRVGLGIGLRAQIHTWGRYGNVWFASAKVEPWANLSRWSFEQDYSADTGFRFVVGEWEGRWLTVSPIFEHRQLVSGVDGRSRRISTGEVRVALPL